MKSARVPWHRSRRTLIGCGVLAGIAAVVVALFAFGPNKNADPEVFTNEPAQVPKPQVKAPFDPDARQVAMRFVQTAVARKHLDEAWGLAGPQVRGGLTHEQWMTGNIPVVPYPLDLLAVAPFKVDASYVDSAIIEIALLPEEERRNSQPDLLHGAQESREGRQGALGRRQLGAARQRGHAAASRNDVRGRQPHGEEFV